MSIQKESKKIITYLLDQAISTGDLTASFFVKYDELANELGLDSENLCRVCFQYLDQLHYIRIIRNDNGYRLVTLNATGIDFLESN